MISLVLLTAAAGCASDGAGDPEPPPAVRQSESRVGAGSARAIAVTDVAITAEGVSLTAGSWPGRALDPVLTVGEVRLTRYDHPAPGVLRFHADGRPLDANAPIFLQWGDDPASRTVVRQ